MTFRLRSLVFLACLLLPIAFLSGVRTGKSIQKSDMSFVPPTNVPLPTPSASPTPTPRATSTFERRQIQECNVSFVLPSYFEESQVASSGATFTDDTATVSVLCNKEAIARTQKETLGAPMASASARVAGQQTTLYSHDQVRTWTLRSLRQTSVLFIVPDGLAELIMSTLRFE